MPVPSTVNDLDPVASNNSPPGSEPIGQNLDEYLRAHAAIIKQVSNTATAASAAAQATADAALPKSGAQVQSVTAFTSAGTAPSFTLTPSPALTAYAANQRFRVKFHAAGAGADTLNVSGLGAKSIKQYDSTGAKVAAVIAAGQLADVEYDGVDFVVMDALPPATLAKQLQAVPTPTLSGNALTVPSAAFSLDFRKTTLTDGGTDTVSGSPAALTIPAGATLGTVSAQKSSIVLLVLNNAGTLEYAVANLSGGIEFSETGLISTTAISASATSASVAYSNTARTNVPYRVVGRIDSTQATAGQWATAPSLVQGAGGEALIGIGAVLAASSGLKKFPCGTIWQWVRISTGSFTDSGTASGSWPMAFPNNCWGIQATPSTIVAIVREGSVSTTGFSLGLNSRDPSGTVAAGTCIVWGVGN